MMIDGCCVCNWLGDRGEGGEAQCRGGDGGIVKALELGRNG